MSRHQVCPVCWVVTPYGEREKLQQMHEDHWLEHIGKDHHPFDLILFAMRVFEDCYHEQGFMMEK